MFEKKVPVFVYCVSPVHMGAGSSIGVIDNPIQRERHTDYPHIAGSGLKGAVRHHFRGLLNGAKDDSNMLTRAFGPEPDAGDDFAGAVSFSDAQILTFPVRCATKAFVYATSPTVMARALRVLGISGIKSSWGDLPRVEQGTCKTASAYSNNKVLLENFEFRCEENISIKNAAAWIAEKAFPAEDAFTFFKNKLKEDLVMISDEDFSYFVKNATVVEPHVRINDETGAAEDGGLFYTENLPPESILITLLMTSKERTKAGLDASAICNWTLFGSGKEGSFKGLDGQMVQIGGDATTGRGQVFFKAVAA
jgi:CRISPR-associated protein Cmr4